MRRSTLFIAWLFVAASMVQAIAETRVDFTKKPAHFGPKISQITTYAGGKGAKPQTLYCSGSCSGGPTYSWQCGDNDHCGLNCAARPPYAYCY
jgi:hypothetical protein